MERTSDARERVAEAIRRCRPKSMGWPIPLASAMVEVTDGSRDPLYELADMVDPTCEMAGNSEAWVTCSACGTALVQPGSATFDGGHVVLRDLAYCPACGARVIGRGVE